MGLLDRFTGSSVKRLAEKRDVGKLIHILECNTSLRSCDNRQLNAAEALASFKEENVIRALIRSLDYHPSITMRAAESLKKIGPDAIPLLEDALRSNLSVNITARIISILGEINNPRAILVLITELANQYSYDGKEARIVDILRGIGPPAVRELILAQQDQRLRDNEQVEFALAELADTDSLLTALDQELSRNGDAAAAFLYLLGRRQDNRAVEPSIRAANSALEGTRHAGIYCLGKLGDILSLEVLLDAMNDPDLTVRLSAAEGLGRLKDPRALHKLIEALSDVSVAVREKVIQELEETADSSAVPALRNVCLEDDDKRVRQYAVSALKKIGGGDAEEALAAYTNAPPFISVTGGWVGCAGELNLYLRLNQRKEIVTGTGERTFGQMPELWNKKDIFQITGRFASRKLSLALTPQSNENAYETLPVTFEATVYRDDELFGTLSSPHASDPFKSIDFHLDKKW